ncbi:MAG: hypothetical protein K2X87_30335 [Gemmataceae bacterium]|nr:hypothetical protein [Gemmataceae bacterium]
MQAATGIFAPTASESGESEIAAALAGHQQTAEWDWKDLARTLYAYDRLLRDWFALDLPPFVIRLGRLRGSAYGHFRPGCNECAVAGEIAINTRYVSSLPCRRALPAVRRGL